MSWPTVVFDEFLQHSTPFQPCLRDIVAEVMICCDWIFPADCDQLVKICISVLYTIIHERIQPTPEEHVAHCLVREILQESFQERFCSHPNLQDMCPSNLFHGLLYSRTTSPTRRAFGNPGSSLPRLLFKSRSTSATA